MDKIETLKSEAFADDKLELKYFAENVKHIMLSSDKPEVFSVNAPWGMGKTYFIDNLKLLIEEKNEAICIKYNAWESDYFNDPLVTILYEITKHPSLRTNKTLKTKSTKFSRQYAFGMSAGLSFGAQAGVNFQGGLSSEDVDLLENYDLTKKAIDSFKQVLKRAYDVKKKQIVIFIDEVDRCNPEYAIKTLEIVKHFFGVQGIKFVIAIDRDQIINLVKTMYGCYDKKHNIDGYLRKFFDIDFYIPEPALDQYSAYLFEKYEFNKLLNLHCFCKGEKGFNTFVKDLCEPLNLSLRDLERIYFKFDKIIRNIDVNFDVIIFDLIFLMVVLRHHDFGRYRYLRDDSQEDSNLETKYKENISELINYARHIYAHLKNKPIGTPYTQKTNVLAQFLDRIESLYKIANYPEKIEFIETAMSNLKRADDIAEKRAKGIYT